jgi:AcrR family transcriptional regulator
MTETEMKTKGWRGSRNAWLNVAKDILIDQGESSVTVQAMAKRLKLSRTSFYWFFQDRQDVMQALLDLWAHTNTKPIQDASNAYAETMVEAVLNVTYTLISEVEYDPHFDAAIRGWAIQSSDVNARLVAEDEKRVGAIRQMMMRHGFDKIEADVRAHAIYLVQLGYTSMQIKENWETRIARVPYYMRTLTGLSPSEAEFERFRAKFTHLDSANEYGK